VKVTLNLTLTGANNDEQVRLRRTTISAYLCRIADIDEQQRRFRARLKIVVSRVRIPVPPHEKAPQTADFPVDAEVLYYPY